MISPEEQKQQIDRLRNTLGGAKPWTLIVEDDESDAFLARSLLHAHGLKTMWVKTTAEAVEMLKLGQYKIVFLDLDLKDGGDPKEILSICRNTGRCVIIILTGAYAPDSPSCTDALRMGATAIMLKPLTNEQVELIYGTP